VFGASPRMSNVELEGTRWMGLPLVAPEVADVIAGSQRSIQISENPSCGRNLAFRSDGVLNTSTQ
jgi:hypothetical protein